ncbi:MAG TPA: hypothetical protein VEX38_09260, partial [Fimbriimonadaceae bacterium]|nr:hypothetical protein [Fimbriimonadaceae bacterium]
NKSFSLLTEQQRLRLAKAGHYDTRYPVSLPAVVRLTQGGAPVAPPQNSRAPGDIELVFDATGARAFPDAYKAQLQAIYANAKNTMDVVFGRPSAGGTILVRNYDADIGDRDAVAGGYFLPNNGSGQMEIRFPIYTKPEATAVNFIHTLLLAYLGQKQYGFDAFGEGLVRAATMRIVRTPGALPAGIDPVQAEEVLDNTYDVSAFYEWYNQRALGGPRFIAPNLRAVPLPSGGSLGGIYLLRYQMAGTAWQKAVVENAGFIAQFNRRFYASTGTANDVPALVAIGQAALDSVKGAANSSIEGMSFASWFQRQYIFETANTLGPKLLVQPIPLVGNLAGQDFGVFDVSATYFETQAGGNEVLLSGTSYPVFWDVTFNRIFPSAQEDQMPISGAYGSVTPNLPNLYAGQPYRATVDIPVSDRIARAYLPAGAVATAESPIPNDFYGTVVGLAMPTGSTARVRLTVGGNVIDNIPVRNFAFGAKINTGAYLGAARLRVDVIRTVNSQDAIVLSRFVNKGPGSLALDLRVGGDVTYTFPLQKGIQTIGLPLEPYRSLPSQILGVPDNRLLLARYNPGRAAYDFYPDTGPLNQGHGYFLRLDTAAANFSVAGKASPNTVNAVALRPGWNLISSPLNETVSFTRVGVVRSTDSPLTYNEAKGLHLGAEVFTFSRGASDAATGAPETGTMVPATSFEPFKAYFVRVLAPEGVVMTFAPASSKAATTTSKTPTGWQTRVTLIGTDGRSEGFIGQSSTASRNFDRYEDSGLPQGPGGLQLLSEATEHLYRDIRQIGMGDTYKLRMDGLVAGRSYTVWFNPALGSAPGFVLRDRDALVYRQMPAQSAYTFTAKSTTHRIEILVNGGN